MGNKKEVNWEKVGVYMAISIGLLTTIFYLFEIKDEITVVRERIAVLETKGEMK